MGWLSGVFTRAGTVHTGSTVWADSAGDGDATISSTEHDDHDQDLADGINACLNKDGSNAWTGDLDAGGTFHITSLAEGAATGDSGRWDEDVASLTLNGTVLEVDMNDGGQLTVDLATVGSAGEVTLSGAQTITGKKTFTTATTPITDLRVLDTIYVQVNQLTSGAAVAIDTTAASDFFLSNDQAMTLTFTWPAASSDADLGANFKTSGNVYIRNATGHGALTLAHATAVTDSEEIGARPTGATEMYVLHYDCIVIGSSRYVWFTYVSA